MLGFLDLALYAILLLEINAAAIICKKWAEIEG